MNDKRMDGLVESLLKKWAERARAIGKDRKDKTGPKGRPNIGKRITIKTKKKTMT